MFKKIKEFIYPDKQHKHAINEWDGTDDQNDRAPFNMKIDKMLSYIIK